MTKEEIIKDKVIIYQCSNESEISFVIEKEDALELMEIYAKQEAFAFSKFKNDYQRIEAMNVRHDQIEKFNGDMYTWIGASDEVIWEAYKKGKQLKRYFEK